MVDIVQLIGKIKGWSEIPKRFEEIYFQRVLFKISEPAAGADGKPFFGMINNGSGPSSS